MRRRHLIEFEDQAWFPGWLRDYLTDFLHFVTNSFDLFGPAVPIVERGLLASGGSTIIDVASGGGGGLMRLAGHLQADFPDLEIVLTDAYPNLPAFERVRAAMPGIFRSESSPVDARAVPDHLRGLRTQFLSFHHFEPETAAVILQNAVDSQTPIAVFEAQKRDLAHLIKFSFAGLNVLAVTPFIRPFRWRRLLFTYLIPLVPFFAFWDGVVSVLRTYSTEEMLAMARQLRDGDRFQWESAEIKNGPMTVVYLLGLPRADAERTLREDHE